MTIIKPSKKDVINQADSLNPCQIVSFIIKLILYPY